MDTENLVCKECKKAFSCTLKWRRANGHWCHDCRRIYIRENLKKFRDTNPEKVAEYKAKYKAANAPYMREWNRHYRARRRQFVTDLKKAPCADCGIQYPPYVMEFDHIKPGKLACVGRIGTHSRQSILAEIAKCELVCANCHRERTHLRRQEKQINGRSIKFQPSRSTAGSIQRSG